MKHTCFLALSLLMITACHNAQQHVDTEDTIARFHDQLPDSTEQAFLKENADSLHNTIDTNKYTKLPFWDTTISHYSAQGYIDTFSVDHQKFRIIHNDTLFDGTLEVYQQGQWHKNFEFELLGNRTDYDRTMDLNGDGFNDLLDMFRAGGKVHLYDPSRKAFSDTINGRLGDEWLLLDSAQHIYYDLYDHKYSNGFTESYLFTFRGQQRIDLLTAEMYFDKDSDSLFITNTRIYLRDTNKRLEQIKPTGKVSIADFDYSQFWETYYQKYKSLVHAL